MDEVILGTLYVVYEYIKRNNLEFLTSAVNDANDIINSFNEVWIKKLYNGDLLKVDRYALLFTNSFAREVCNKLGGNRISTNEIFGFSNSCFTDFLMIYIELKNNGHLEKFFDSIEEYYKTHKVPLYNGDVVKIISLFERIYKNLDLDTLEKLKLNKTKMINYIRLIVDKGLLEPLGNLPDNNDMEENILNNIVISNFIADVDQEFIGKERTRQIIHERFGINGTRALDLSTIGKIHGISRERVRQIEVKTLRELRRKEKLRQYANIGN